MDDSIVTLGAFPTPTEANIIAGRLESEGIPCFVTDEYMNSVKPLPTHIAGIRVRVFQRDLEKAHNLIYPKTQTGQNFTETPKKSFFCPKCHSSNISPGAAVNNIFAWLHFLISMFLLKPMKLERFDCYDCGHKFQRAQVVV